MANSTNASKKWALFLDRDGVINERIPDDYVKKAEEFLFLSGVKEALAILAKKFYPIVIVTNQQGIGRGLMTNEQLEQVHKYMMDEIAKAGGRIDAVYVSPDLKTSHSFTRKPAVGMGLKARNQFHGLNFKQSFMVGDTASDIKFGYRLGMYTVLVGNDRKELFACSEMLDYQFGSLMEFAGKVDSLIR